MKMFGVAALLMSGQLAILAHRMQISTAAQEPSGYSFAVVISSKIVTNNGD